MINQASNCSNFSITDHLKPHFILVPQLAQGHMIPMVDMAYLLANHGAIVTFVTTPVNAARINTTIDRVAKSGLPIQFLPLRFPCIEAGLPEGCENLDTLPSTDLVMNFANACAMLREPLLKHLQEQKHGQSCMISDETQLWTREISLELGIPRFMFNGFGCFALLCNHILLHDRKMIEAIPDDSQPFVLLGLPHKVEITKAQVPGNFSGPGIDKFKELMMEFESTADGVLVNSFDYLEHLYVDCYEKLTGKKVWMIGPMSLCNKNVSDMAVRGNKASIDEDKCLTWLDSMKEPGSVVYVSFGSLASTPPSQLIEIGLGLEASKCKFIWVIKAGNKSSEVEEWLSEGFEERTAARGLIIRGWAPQLMILSHPAVGGFMTHCGWNSTLESVSAGVPMITWPHFAEQFINEKLIVEVLKIGFAIGVKTPVKWGSENNSEMLVKMNDIEKIVCRLMDSEEQGKEVRERAKLLGIKAKQAMKEGGSSYENMTRLVQRIQNHTA